FEPLSGCSAVATAVASPTGVQAQSGCALKVADAGLKLIGLIQRPSFIGAIACRTALKESSGNRGRNFDVGVPSHRGSGCCGESGSQSPLMACQPSSRTKVSS